MRDGKFTGYGNLSRYCPAGGTPDFIGARKLVNPGAPYSNAKALADYAVGFLSEIPKLLQGNGIATANLQPKIAAPLAAAPEIVKGNKLVVNIGGYSYEFFHQSTTTSNKGTTTLTGQGVRYVMNRRTRNQTFENLRFSDLVTKVAKAHGVTAVIEAGSELTYQYVDQTGISDYALLKRECEKAGLFLSEQNGKLLVKSLKNIRDTQLVLEPGINLVSYDIKDVAVDSSKEDNSTALLQSENKVKLNPITGQFEALKPDVDTAKDNAATGADKGKADSKITPGQEVLADQARARKKRVKGLPSSFSIPLTEQTLAIAPMDAIRTKGLPGILSRIWLVDVVTHDVDKGITQLSCYSPIEVIDNSPQPSASSATVGQDAAYSGTGKGQAIYKAASALRGFSSRGGAGGGIVACVWAVNRVFEKAGLKTPWGGSEAVYVAQQALDRLAVSVPASQAQPGDIAIWNRLGTGVGGGQHIGVVMASGASSILSNSSGARSFSWDDSGSNYERYYGTPTRYYRLK